MVPYCGAGGIAFSLLFGGGVGQGTNVALKFSVPSKESLQQVDPLDCALSVRKAGVSNLANFLVRSYVSSFYPGALAGNIETETTPGAAPDWS